LGITSFLLVGRRHTRQLSPHNGLHDACAHGSDPATHPKVPTARSPTKRYSRIDQLFDEVATLLDFQRWLTNEQVIQSSFGPIDLQLAT
jgi:hypothetical protein